ncbi:MAG: prepilin-type N-terminal cleavage/methylation domain-containing protein [Chitinophagales bacterium]
MLVYRTKRGEAGFTLLEILAVFAILAIIIALAMPTFLRIRNRAEQSGCVKNQKMLEHTAYIYETANPNAFDYDGGHGPDMEQLKDYSYLKETVECPVTDTDTYNFTYGPGYCRVTCSNGCKDD